MSGGFPAGLLKHVPTEARPYYTSLQDVPFRVNAVGAALVPDQEALKPGVDERVAPGAIDALYETFVTVTAPPLCATVPFQSCVIVCPLANENFSVQPLMAVVPVLLMVIVAPKPVGHWLVTT